jgi:hypothetical protein
VLLVESSGNEDEGSIGLKFSSRSEHLAIPFGSPESADIAAKQLAAQWSGYGLHVFWI